MRHIADTVSSESLALPQELTMPAQSPSPSALKVAALRALHQTADKPPIFVDPLAARIIGPVSSDLLAAQRPLAETARLRGTLAVRSVVAEEAIDGARRRGVRQVVILGAGLDTFAYRNDASDLMIFEVDHPVTQVWKRNLLRDAEIPSPPSLRYVAADFEKDDFITALIESGFDRARPAVFTLLGVTPYVARASLLETLRKIGSSAEGSEIVFDYTEPFQDAPDAIRLPYEAAAAGVAASGEPWVTLFEPTALQLALRNSGFVGVEDLDAVTLHRRFCADRTDGLTIAPLVHLIRART